MTTKTAEEVIRAAGKQASQYFEKVDKSLLYHAAVLHETDWLLSYKKEETQPPSPPLFQDLAPPDREDCYLLAIPHTKRGIGKQFSAQEVHQLVREVVEGIYVFNQTPSINFEANNDSSTTCSIPSAYVDTLVGQSLFAVDYYIKSLLHGSTIPMKEKRIRINEKWRKTVSENSAGLHQLYSKMGMAEMKDDEELGNEIYVEKFEPFHRYPSILVDHSLAALELALHRSTSEEQAHKMQEASRHAFLQHLEQVNIGILLGLDSVQQSGSLILYKPSVDVFSSISAGIKSSKDNPKMLSPLQTYLQKQREFVRQLLRKKQSISHDLDLLQFVHFLTVFLSTLKQQHKTVNCTRLLPRMNPDTLKTDREIPPFLPTEDSRWSPQNHYCGANGKLSFNKHPVTIEPLNEEMCERKENIYSRAFVHQHRDTMTVTIGEQSYTLITIHLEDYYPKFPRWLYAMETELKARCLKNPPISDMKVQDLLRRPLGPKQASKLKTINVMLVPCIEKGLIGPVAALVKRSTKTRISKLDENGMALIHYAAAYGRADMISLLLHYGASPTQPYQQTDQSVPSSSCPIHLATQAGDIDSVSCLVRNKAPWDVLDDNGWAPIHHAAFGNYGHIIKLFGSFDMACIEMPTQDKVGDMPLLLAAESGALDSVKTLAELGANVAVVNKLNQNLVHIAAVNKHINVLQFAVVLDNPHLLVLATLSEMLKADTSSGYPQAASYVLDSLIRWRSDQYKELMKLDCITQLTQLARSSDEELQLLSVQVLADISNQSEVVDALIQSQAIPVLVKHLSSPNDRLQSCCCVLLCDLGLHQENQSIIAADNGMKHVINLLSSMYDDVQLYSAACIGILCQDNPKNQELAREYDGIPLLIALLNSKQACIQGCAAATLQVLLHNCYENKTASLDGGIVLPLVALLKSKATSVHSNASRAIESLAEDCLEAQSILQNDEASLHCTVLLRTLVKVCSSQVKVCAASALWAIAGKQIHHRRRIASFIGIDTLVTLLAFHDKKMDYVCSEAIGTLASELGRNQNIIAELGGLIPLVEVLLLTKSSTAVYISVLRTLASLVIKPGLVPNKELQKAVVDARGMVFITALLLSPMSDIIRVEAACTLAKLVLANPANEQKLMSQSGFSHYVVLQLLAADDPEVRLLAGYALSVFVFNNPSKLQQIKSHGSIHLSNFADLLSSSDETSQAHAAFQLVILSKLIIGARDVEVSIHGIKLLSQLCTSDSETTKIISTEFLACLARCKEGIPTAMVMAGVITPLMDNLSLGNPPIEEVSSAALGFFSFLPFASRLIRSRFRSEPALFKVFQKYIELIKVSPKFLDDWTYSETTGFPALSIERRGGTASGRTTSEPPGAANIAVGKRIKTPAHMKKLPLHTFPSIRGGVPAYLADKQASVGLLNQHKQAQENFAKAKQFSLH